jgi:Uma2 family endonuclease
MIFSKQMATKQLITAEQYLATPYEREPEFVHGELVERSLPTFPHGNLQLSLGARLFALTRVHGLFSGVEVRVRIAPDVYRIPDIAMWERAPGDLPDTPPLLVVEILSPDDRMHDVIEKLEEYRAWGVSLIWIVEPELKRLFVYDGRLQETAQLDLSRFGFSVTASELFV